MIILGLGFYIWFLHRHYDKIAEKRREDRAAEHQAWRETTKELASEGREVAKAGYDAIYKNTDVLSGLKTLLESTRERK